MSKWVSVLVILGVVLPGTPAIAQEQSEPGRYWGIGFGAARYATSVCDVVVNARFNCKLEPGFAVRGLVGKDINPYFSSELDFMYLNGLKVEAFNSSGNLTTSVDALSAGISLIGKYPTRWGAPFVKIGGAYVRVIYPDAARSGPVAFADRSSDSSFDYVFGGGYQAGNLRLEFQRLLERSDKPMNMLSLNYIRGF